MDPCESQPIIRRLSGPLHALPVRSQRLDGDRKRCLILPVLQTPVFLGDPHRPIAGHRDGAHAEETYRQCADLIVEPDHQHAERILERTG